MGTVRITFSSPQRVSDVMPADALVSEVVVEADRLVLLQGDDVQVDVSPDVVAWAGPAQQESAEQEAQPGKQKPPNEGKPWSAEEAAQLAARFEAGVTKTRELAELHGRSTSAIRSRLRILGLV